MTAILKSRRINGNPHQSKQRPININVSVIKFEEYQKQVKDLSAEGAILDIKREKIVREVQTETEEESCTNIVYDDSEDASLNSDVDSCLDARNTDTQHKSIAINLMKEEKVESALPN